MGLSLLLSCEHGGRRVPSRYRHLFAGRGELLASHRGSDPGVFGLCHYLSRRLSAPRYVATVTRLLVDLNRAPSNPSVFSEITRPLPVAERALLLERYHRPHRQAVADHAACWIAEGRRVFHLSLHSFTPVWRGEERRTDLGLLYDPARPLEKELCCRWQALLRAADGSLRVHRNAPYRGVSDALVTTLRRTLPAAGYLGIELEVNQCLAADGTGRWRQALETTLRALMEGEWAG